ncbi:6-phosphogluconolactonase [Thermus tenuipuniceus]|uniref:6-phosphogluconolactonase n=1 Tax=Thermus tenuipuniceus TaxID=2078690 RepID=UPI000CFA5D49|nr:6-phosphogluconolactonase [Thermus tenuipuniceus]
MGGNLRFRTFPTPEAALEEALAWLLEGLPRARTGVLAGGKTPLPLYRALAGRGVEFHGVLLLSDERWLSPDDPGTNLFAVGQALGPLAQHLLPFPLDLPPMAAQEWMESRLLTLLPLDLALLGIGEDGHTASLFPGSPVLVSSHLVEVVHGPKPACLRLTLTPKAFRGTRQTLFLALGEHKRQALRRLFRGEDLPPLRVAQEVQGAFVYTDQEVD